MSIGKGVLYLVATPIGNLDDFSLRARSVLEGADLVAAEDTRHSRALLRRYGIATPLVALHEHNEARVLEQILGRLAQGERVALISDAGTPLISDPGFPLVRRCREAGITVSPVPGPCAAIAALSASGIATDRFLFEGFPPRTREARLRSFEALGAEGRTLLFYESSHRVLESLRDMAAAFGGERRAVVARELTKLHETFLCDTLSGLVAALEDDADQRRGEFVVVVAGAEDRAAEADAEAERVLRLLAAELPSSQAASLAARITGQKRNRLYRLALALEREPPKGG